MDITFTLIAQSIAMVIFVAICMKFVWPPLLEMIEERQKEIDEGLAAAEKGQSALDRASAEAEKIVEDARKQATAILDQANARANEIVADGKSDGVKERDRQLSAAQAEIEQETNRAREELRGQVSTIALAGAAKILEREIDEKSHQDILGKLAAEL
ncbi:MAG: F0F1 ATP synthase subunit B [Pseudomonadota bacterium]